MNLSAAKQSQARPFTLFLPICLSILVRTSLGHIIPLATGDWVNKRTRFSKAEARAIIKKLTGRAPKED